MIMVMVMLVVIKIGGVMFGLSLFQIVLIVLVVMVVYILLGGFCGVILIDFFQFILVMVGIIWVVIVIVNLFEVGGLDKFFSYEEVCIKLYLLFDFNDSSQFISLFIFLFVVQWWSVWYFGVELGGGGYIVQCMFFVKDEKNVVGVIFLFNIVYYVLCFWLWIFIVLVLIIVFFDLEFFCQVFLNINE